MAAEKEKSMQGVVLWFDKDKGDGQLLYEGSSYYFHYSSIDSADCFKVLEKGDMVSFTLYENLYMKQVDWIKKI